MEPSPSTNLAASRSIERVVHSARMSEATITLAALMEALRAASAEMSVGVGSAEDLSELLGGPAVLIRFELPGAVAEQQLIDAVTKRVAPVPLTWLDGQTPLDPHVPDKA